MADFWQGLKDLATSPQRAAKRTEEELPWSKKLSALAKQAAETPGVDIGIAPIGTVIGKVPRSIFAKKYARKIALGDREIWQFPQRYGTPELGSQVEIPVAIRKSAGQLHEDILPTLMEAYNKAKSELGYTHIQDLIDLTGLPKEDVHNTIISLVKAGKAAINVDRWGKAVYVKLK